MKKFIVIVVFCLCLCLLVGCGIQEVLQDIAGQLAASTASPADVQADGNDTVSEPELDAEPVSASDVGGQEEPAAAPQLPEEEQDVDFTALSVSECVADADGAPGQLPVIILECPGAASINEDIEGTFRYLVGDDYCTLYYTASKNGPILSVMIAQLYDGDASYYTPYLLDLSTGERIGGRGLLGVMDLSEDDVSAAELRIMGEEFEYQYGPESLGENADFYQEQLERTTAGDNAELNRLWLDDEGELNFVARIYSLAGAEFYEYPMGTGYFY